MTARQTDYPGMSGQSNNHWSSGSFIGSHLQTSRSMPNIHEQDSDLDSSQHLQRERCNTVSRPIRIPAVAKSLLTVENVERQQQELSTSFPSIPLAKNVELVKCDDIVIHLDSLQSPKHASTGAFPTHSPYAVQSGRIGSAPPDFMGDFNPRQGEKIPNKMRSRQFIAGVEEHSLPLDGKANITVPSYLPPRRGQTLVSFLEDFSSNDSELERENAHFSICQAVICALEHLKWNRKHHWQSETPANEDVVPNPQLPSVSDVGASGAAAEWPRETNTAKVCGLTLLSRFRDLPKASEIHWSGFDVGYGSQSGSCVGTDAWPKGSLWRGTSDWAPPRPQIIFTKKGLYSSRKKKLQEQNYRCRGCGSYVTLEYSKTFRFCVYTGQYYCTACHRNQLSVIPAYVLDDWNFKLYPVSVVAYRLLDDIWFSPLFNISSINPQLFSRAPVLQARKLRGALQLARKHVLACRFYRQGANGAFQNLPEYFVTDLELWSMADLKAVKQGSFKDYVGQFVKTCEAHVASCELCLARGYLCELCHSGEILFPWHSRIRRCSSCGSCVHELCHNQAPVSNCGKCLRIRLRT